MNDAKLTFMGILWDVDGTICDALNLAFTSTNIVLQNHGYDNITIDQFKFGTRFPTAQRLYWHATGNEMSNVFHSISSSIQDENQSILALGLTLGNEFDNLYVDLVDDQSCIIYEGIFDLLKTINTMKNIETTETKIQLKSQSQSQSQSQPQSQSCGIKMGLLSNACGKYVDDVCDALAIREYFDVVYGADNVPAAKPSPAGLLQICNELELLPYLCIYIGDSPTDGLAARSAGMYSIGVAWGANIKQDLVDNFDIVVDTVVELKYLLISVINSHENGNTAVATDIKSLHAHIAHIPVPALETNMHMNPTLEPSPIPIETIFSNINIQVQEDTSQGTSDNVSNLSTTATTTTTIASKISKVKWDYDVIDNENLNEYRTDDETWSGDRYTIPRPTKTV